MKPEERKQNQALWQERMNDWQQSGTLGLRLV
ncbi:hypothetical protein V5J37_002257 [Endozoicomonas sp. NE43]